MDGIALGHCRSPIAIAHCISGSPAPQTGQPVVTGITTRAGGTTEAQASSAVSEAFKKADKNGDGAIERDEFNASFTTPGPDTRSPTTPPPQVPPTDRGPPR